MAVTVLLFGFLLVATYTDVRWRKIYNWTTYSGILLAIALSLACSLFAQTTGLNSLDVWGAVAPSDSLVGMSACGGMMLVCYVFFPGGIGGGDIKLLAMVGAFLGVMAGLEVMLWTFVLAACMALIVLVWRYGLPALIVRSARFALYKLRLGSAFQLSDQERQPLKTDLFLSPSTMAAFWIVRLDLASWM
ncbi:MAG: A24 family peptidase [Pirellulaceae bacterium]|nr:A24 family peptidase [Pirellulaceae bacterium]MDP6554981.1 A24 family peptidase [Pirellulaceae bacterium]MDP6720818.1 A24 family peptidase [Pirellulaceae bacterium]